MAKPKQEQIPGTERKVIPAITKAAEELKAVRTERVKLTKDEGVKVQELIAVMKEHDLTDYEDPDGNDGDGIEAHILVTKQRVKVGSLTDKDSEEPEVETE